MGWEEMLFLDTSSIIESNKEEDAKFLRNLGLFESVMFGIGGMIGAGVFALSGLLAYNLHWFAIISLVIAGFLSVLTGYIYGHYSTRINMAGGGYNFVKSVLGDNVAVFSGWWFFIAYSFAGAFYAGVFGIYLQILLGIPYYIFSFLMITFFGVINYIGVKESGSVEGFLTLFKISVIISILIAGYITLNSGLSSASLPKIDPLSILVYAAIMFIALEGFDIISTLSEEIKEPEKNVPRAIFISIIVVITLYILIIVLDVIVVEMGLTKGLLMEEIILMVAYKSIGEVGYFLLIAGALVSTLSAYNATIIAASRVAYALAKDGHFPTFLNHIHSENKTPHMAVIVSSALIFTILFYVHYISDISTISSSLGSISSLSFLLAFSTVHITYFFDKDSKVCDNKICKRTFIPLLGMALIITFSVLIFYSNPIASLILIVLSPASLLLSKLSNKKG